MEVHIESPPGQVIGYVKQSKSSWRPKFEIQDANQQTMLSIGGPCCPCQNICCTDDIDFNVLTPDGSQQLGRVAKQWGGLIREWITKADNFCVQFPIDLDIKMKAVLIGATFLIDFMYFERSKND
ncbi:phospholipid scramblase 3-like [Amphiura filiformis]|uniref:phospholipid scramblase 3-like n=1 Tax=Amphiura filiformis TaxID=82378 RepID=UPI003B225B52